MGKTIVIGPPEKPPKTPTKGRSPTRESVARQRTLSAAGVKTTIRGGQLVVKDAESAANLEKLRAEEAKGRIIQPSEAELQVKSVKITEGGIPTTPTIEQAKVTPSGVIRPTGLSGAPAISAKLTARREKELGRSRLTTTVFEDGRERQVSLPVSPGFASALAPALLKEEERIEGLERAAKEVFEEKRKEFLSKPFQLFPLKDEEGFTVEPGIVGRITGKQFTPEAKERLETKLLGPTFIQARERPKEFLIEKGKVAALSFGATSLFLGASKLAAGTVAAPIVKVAGIGAGTAFVAGETLEFKRVGERVKKAEKALRTTQTKPGSIIFEQMKTELAEARIEKAQVQSKIVSDIPAIGIGVSQADILFGKKGGVTRKVQIDRGRKLTPTERFKVSRARDIFDPTVEAGVISIVERGPVASKIITTVKGTTGTRRTPFRSIAESKVRIEPPKPTTEIVVTGGKVTDIPTTPLFPGVDTPSVFRFKAPTVSPIVITPKAPGTKIFGRTASISDGVTSRSKFAALGSQVTDSFQTFGTRAGKRPKQVGFDILFQERVAKVKDISVERGLLQGFTIKRGAKKPGRISADIDVLVTDRPDPFKGDPFEFIGSKRDFKSKSIFEVDKAIGEKRLKLVESALVKKPTVRSRRVELEIKPERSRTTSILDTRPTKKSILDQPRINIQEQKVIKQQVGDILTAESGRARGRAVRDITTTTLDIAPKVAIAQRAKTTTLQIQQPALKLSQRTTSILDTTTTTKQGQLFRTTQDISTRTTTRPRTTTGLDPAFGGGLIGVPTGVPGITGGGIFLPPLLGGGKGRGRRKEPDIFKQPTRRVASPIAAFFDIKAKQEDLTKTKFTGLEIIGLRPTSRLKLRQIEI